MVLITRTARSPLARLALVAVLGAAVVALAGCGAAPARTKTPPAEPVRRTSESRQLSPAELQELCYAFADRFSTYLINADVEINRIVAKTGLPSRTVFTITKKKMLMDQIEQIRRRGYAIDDEESTEDQRCVGVALKNIHGRLLGAVSVSGRKRTMDQETIEDLAGLLKSLAQEITARLGTYVLPVQMVP